MWVFKFECLARFSSSDEPYNISHGATKLVSWLPAGKTVITSDHALKLETVPEWIVIVGSGYIGLEFSDVYTALGSEVSVADPVTHFLSSYLFLFTVIVGEITSTLYALTQTEAIDLKYVYILMLHYLFSMHASSINSSILWFIKDMQYGQLTNLQWLMNVDNVYSYWH